MEIAAKALLIITWIAFTYVCVFFFFNIDAPDGLKHASLLIASVISFVGNAFTLVSNTKGINRRFEFVIFYDDQQQQLVATTVLNAYRNRYFHMFSHLNDTDLRISLETRQGQPIDFNVNDGGATLKALTELGDKGLDFIEYGLLVLYRGISVGIGTGPKCSTFLQVDNHRLSRLTTRRQFDYVETIFVRNSLTIRS